MGTGLLRCPVCGAALHVKYSSTAGYRTDKSRAAKYTCPNKPRCSAKRLLISETNDKLWGALLELLVHPERIHELIAPEPKSDVDTLKKELGKAEREQRTLQEKQARLLDLYLEGNVPQASYVVKAGQLEKEAEALAGTRTSLQQRINSNGKATGLSDLIQTLRLLARSHRRFTEEQKTKVFRSIIKEARLNAAGVELEMYVQPTQNIWWKYRQKKARDSSRSVTTAQTIRIRTRETASR
jgi:hypothetical protein